MKLKYIIYILAYSVVAIIYTGCDKSREEATPEVGITIQDEQQEIDTVEPVTDVSSSEVHVPSEDKLLTIEEYSLGVYPYYNNMVPTFSHKVVNKSMTVDGEQVVVKNIIRLTVGYRNEGSLPIAYLWSLKPAIDMVISDGKDVTGYPDHIGENYNVHYLMPGETIAYDYLIYPSSEDRVVFEGEIFFSFIPIQEDIIVDNTDYDLNNIFNPVMGAKTYTDYMVHSSQKFKVNTQKGVVEIIEEQSTESSIESIRHEYFSVESSVMEIIKKNEYEFKNVTPIYELRYDFTQNGQAQDFIDDIYANIPIHNNLQHTKNQYFGVMDDKSIIYVPDINKLTEFDIDRGRYYDIYGDKDVDKMLEESRLNLADTVARFVKIDGYISMILFSDNNYEYIKPVEDYQEFNISKDKLYTPEQISKNISQNINNFNTEEEHGLSPAVEARLIEEVNSVIERLEEGESGLPDVPNGIELPIKEIELEEVSLDIDSKKNQAIVSISLDEEIILLLILEDIIEDPKLEIATFLGEENKLVYDEENMLETINEVIRKYNEERRLNHDKYNKKPFKQEIEKLTSLEEVIVQQDSESMDTANVYVKVDKGYDMKIEIIDFVDECEVVKVEFINKDTEDK